MTGATATDDLVQIAAVRRKVEAWLAENDQQTAIALRGRPEWTDDPVLTVNNRTVRIVPCPTPLAARAALHDRADTELLVLLTDLTDVDLGDGVLAHVSRCTVRSIDAWDMVRQMFGLETLDPTLADKRFGGGSWLAAALTDLAPQEGWPPPAGTVLTRDHALRCLTGQLLGLARDQLDISGLLEWSTHAPAVMDFTRLSADTVAGVTAFLADTAGPAAAAVMAAVRAGHGVDAIALGLVAAALWPRSANKSPVDTQIAIARTRLEPLFGGLRLNEAQADALRTAAEAWVDRAAHSENRGDAQRALARAETLAADIHATDLMEASELLPTGLVCRLRTLADAIGRAVDQTAVDRTAADTVTPATAVAEAERALAIVEQHRFVEPHIRDTARMAVRLLRWLSTTDSAPPATLLDAVHRQVRDDAWVDRARLDVFAGSTNPQVTQAYKKLYHAVDARRRAHDEQFAHHLAAAARADSQPGTLLRVEDVLERLVRPILNHGRRVLLVILDGMSTAAATELAESVVRSGAWLELTPAGGPRTGVLAALPTVTEASRCSLLSGRIAVGRQKEESAALQQRFPDSLLLHKAGLRAGAGAALDPEVVSAVEDPFVPLVAAVVNTIDDALDRSDPGTIVWSQENINAVRDLLAHAQERVVVLVSDHGHVIDRGKDAITRPSPSSENRWRPAQPAAGDGEIPIAGPRVALGGGTVVLPWREDIRYGPRKAGYHGGATPAEAVIPLIVLSAGHEDAVPGWQGAPVASPTWWREPVTDMATPATQAPATRRKPLPRTDQGPVLFDLNPATVPPPTGQPPAGQSAAHHHLITQLLASEIYTQRNVGRTRLPNDRVARMLAVLLAGGGRASMETLAADAAVPAHRIAGTVTALRKLLQVEGYAVVELDADGVTVKLDEALLIEQFHLGSL